MYFYLGEKKMKKGFYYVLCDKCHKIQQFEKLKEDDPFWNDDDNDGIKAFSCSCGNIDISIFVCKEALWDFP